MKNLKDLLIEANDLVVAKKEQRQKVVLFFVLLGTFLYLVWTGNIADLLSEASSLLNMLVFPGSGAVVMMIVLIVVFAVCWVVRSLFMTLPIGKVRVKTTERMVFRLYHKELLRLEESKSDVEKNIALLKEKLVNYQALLDIRAVAVSERLDLEETELIEANDELQRFHQEVDPYVRPIEVSPDITSYIR